MVPDFGFPLVLSLLDATAFYHHDLHCLSSSFCILVQRSNSNSLWDTTNLNSNRSSTTSPGSPYKLLILFPSGVIGV